MAARAALPGHALPDTILRGPQRLHRSKPAVRHTA